MSFPALIFAGVPSISANATNNAAMWVGTIGGARGYWPDVRPHRKMLAAMLVVSAIGSVIGACLLLLTPTATFDRLIPWLLLFATVVFAVSPRLTKSKACHPELVEGPEHQTWQLIVQFFVAIYGGYFGAGMGILMLAILAFSGLPSFNATNGMKNVMSVAINGVALVPFIIARVVDWHFAVPMAVMALLGGYFGAKFFRRMPQPVARTMVIAIGIAMTIVFFVRR